MATVVRSFAIQGIDGYPVDIEIKMLEGQPSISIIGLGDQAVLPTSLFLYPQEWLCFSEKMCDHKPCTQ